jgi:hypothetical protein
MSGRTSRGETRLRSRTRSADNHLGKRSALTIILTTEQGETEQLHHMLTGAHDLKKIEPAIGFRNHEDLTGGEQNSG